MKPILILLGLALPFAPCAAQAQGPEWKEFASKPGNFRVLLPGVPKEHKQTMQTPAGPVVLTVFVERARVRNTGKLAAQVMNDLRIRVFTHIQRLSLDYFTDEKAGVVMTRMTSDIEVLQQLLQDGLAQFAIQGLTMVLVTTILFTYNWLLALITIGTPQSGP